MKKIVSLIIIISLVSSCSTLRKSVFYGVLSGLTIGAVGGGTLSPNKESVAPNMMVWGSLGALIGAGLGYFFFMDDPENREMPSMILPKNKVDPVNKLETYSITPTDSKKYRVESGPIPENLKDKVKSPFIIEHEIPERVEQLENGKTITVEKHKAWEYSYE